MTLCPTCATDWPRNSMSGVAVELLGGCLWCKYGPTHGGDGSAEGFARVRAEYYARRGRIEYVTLKPSP